MAYHLYSASGERIYTYGHTTLTVSLNLKRAFTWKFWLAQVTHPIIGADILSHFGLLIDLKNRCVRDPLTQRSSTGYTIHSPNMEVHVMNRDGKFSHLLAKFPDLTQPFSCKTPAKHNTVHIIETTGRPVFAKPRRLHPTKFAAAKREFEFMMERGICRPSKSNWASPLHLVPKANGGWIIEPQATIDC